MACKRSAVRSRLAPPNFSQKFGTEKTISRCGGIAQLGERLHGMQEVSGSIPLISTKFLLVHQINKSSERNVLVFLILFPILFVLSCENRLSLAFDFATRLSSD